MNRSILEQKQAIESKLMVFCFKCVARTNNKFIKEERTYGKLGESIKKNSKPMNSLNTVNFDIEIYDSEKQDYKFVKHYECWGEYTKEDEKKTKKVVRCKEYITAKYWAKEKNNLNLEETLKEFDKGLDEMFFTYYKD